MTAGEVAAFEAKYGNKVSSREQGHWEMPRCGNLNIGALLTGVVCDIRVT
jgi:hypothetical protein